jgi:hypothetical protein
LLSGTPVDGTGGTYKVTLTATNGVSPNATQTLALTVRQAPAITSPGNTTFVIGSAGSLHVAATGFPAPTFTKTGVLPSGVTLSTAGLLSGTPASGTSGPYAITVTAANGVAPSATQAFTLTVDQRPAITSAASTTFKVASLDSFQVTASGFPAPTFTETGALPGGVTLSTAGKLSATPATGTGGTYAVTITATNTAGSATQKFTLTVKSA